MQARMTQTMKKVLDSATRKGRHDVALGHKSGRTFGTREKDAAEALVRMGLLVNNGTRRYSETKWGGATTSWSETIYLPAGETK